MTRHACRRYQKGRVPLGQRCGEGVNTLITLQGFCQAFGESAGRRVKISGCEQHQRIGADGKTSCDGTGPRGL